jgi:hypothetical protein
LKSPDNLPLGITVAFDRAAVNHSECASRMDQAISLIAGGLSNLEGGYHLGKLLKNSKNCHFFEISIIASGDLIRK